MDAQPPTPPPPAIPSPAQPIQSQSPPPPQQLNSSKGILIGMLIVFIPLILIGLAIGSYFVFPDFYKNLMKKPVDIEPPHENEIPQVIEISREPDPLGAPVKPAEALPQEPNGKKTNVTDQETKEKTETTTTEVSTEEKTPTDESFTNGTTTVEVEADTTEIDETETKVAEETPTNSTETPPEVPLKKVPRKK